MNSKDSSCGIELAVNEGKTKNDYVLKTISYQ